MNVTNGQRYLEIRRHSNYGPDGNLSGRGRGLAAHVGQDSGPFGYVVTSTLARAIQTAEAMGFQVHEQVRSLEPYGAVIDSDVHWAAGFSACSEAYHRRSAFFHYATHIAGLTLGFLDRAGSEGNLLVVAHGGVVEAIAIGCTPEADHKSWGPAVSYCEGVRLRRNGKGTFELAEVLRC